ncbi:hypothetical protein JCM24511_07562 [Saitozyma sp. JCM 24511]|nr:hypothetical protein JCM24511_07562 [Saitozyma sp. JCM 24511]
MSSASKRNSSRGKEPLSETQKTSHRRTFSYPVTAWFEVTNTGVSTAVSPFYKVGKFCPLETRDELRRRFKLFEDKIGYGSAGTSDSPALRQMTSLWNRNKTRAEKLWTTKVTSAVEEFYTFETASWRVEARVVPSDEFDSCNQKRGGLVALDPQEVHIYTWVECPEPSQSDYTISPVTRLLDIPASDDFADEFDKSLEATLVKIANSEEYQTSVKGKLPDISLVESDWQSRVMRQAKHLWRKLDGPQDVEFVPGTKDQYDMKTRSDRIKEHKAKLRALAISMDTASSSRPA